jgi:large subunit ribosomal protein L13
MERKQTIINAENVRLGQVATQVANALMGKNSPDFTYYRDDGDKVVVYNVSKMDFADRKKEQKIYYRYSGYPGGIYSETLGKLFARDPKQVLRKAVFGMLPKNRLRAKMLNRLEMHIGEIN